MHTDFYKAFESLKNKFGVEAKLSDPKIAYRETIRKAAEAEGKHKKQSGGAGQFGVVNIKFEPGAADGEFEFVDAIVGGAVPKQFIPAVEKGLREAIKNGVLAGYPMVNLKATLFDGKYHPGYQDMIEELTTKFPLTEERITGEQRQKEFIVLFGAILRMRNLLTSFDEFAGSEILSERDFQDYLGRYQDLRDEWKNRKPGGEKEDITDDIVFEIELIKQIEINIDYILLLVQKYHDSHCDDKEVLITILKAVDASPELRSKKALIETFIAGINDVSDVMLEWRTFVAEEKERQLVAIIQEENLKDDETRRFMESAFRDGSVKTTGTDIDRLMPPISRFGGGNRAAKKQTIIDKLKGFFDRFFGIG